jgi:L-threonylcarbamoyladenylate synthase
MKEQRGDNRVVRVDATDPDNEVMADAATLIRDGQVVAFPTETVYGLGADATNARAVGRIFEAKGRPSDNPLIVHVASRSDVLQVATEVPPMAERLMERFWPGPLTIVLHRRPNLPENVTGGLATVGVRMPRHAVALALIRAAGVPLAAPSANLSGRPSPTRAEHVTEDLGDRISMTIDAGETGVGIESTVVDLTVDPPLLLRPGGVTVEDLIEVLGPVTIDRSEFSTEFGEAPKSPGIKYAHYAPNAKMILVDGPLLLVQDRIRHMIFEFQDEGQKVGVMCSDESSGVYTPSVVLQYGSREDLTAVASGLFNTLRAFNRHEVDVIIAESVPIEGIGVAIMNRLRKAASGQVISVCE